MGRADPGSSQGSWEVVHIHHAQGKGLASVSPSFRQRKLEATEEDKQPPLLI